jgi:hypothetical protein
MDSSCAALVMYFADSGIKTPHFIHACNYFHYLGQCRKRQTQLNKHKYGNMTFKCSNIFVAVLSYGFLMACIS